VLRSDIPDSRQHRAAEEKPRNTQTQQKLEQRDAAGVARPFGAVVIVEVFDIVVIEFVIVIIVEAAVIHDRGLSLGLNPTLSLLHDCSGWRVDQSGAFGRSGWGILVGGRGDGGGTSGRVVSLELLVIVELVIVGELRRAFGR